MEIVYNSILRRHPASSQEWQKPKFKGERHEIYHQSNRHF